MVNGVFGLKEVDEDYVCSFKWYDKCYAFDEKDFIVGRAYTRFFDGIPEASGDMILYKFQSSEIKFVRALNGCIDVLEYSISAYVADMIIEPSLPKPYKIMEIVPATERDTHVFHKVEIKFPKLPESLNGENNNE